MPAPDEVEGLRREQAWEWSDAYTPPAHSLVEELRQEMPGAVRRRGPRRAGRSPSARRRLILIGVLAGVALALVGCGGFQVYARQQNMQPVQVANAYCAALTHRDYAGAYTKLSSRAQGGVSQADYIAAQHLSEQVDGPVTACSVQQPASTFGLTWQLDGTTVALTARVTRASVATGTLRLARRGASWRIDMVDAGLLGSDLQPLDAVHQFCAALTQRDFKTAWRYLSSTYQQGYGSEDAYVREFDGVNGASCHETLSTYRVNGALATLELTFSDPSASFSATCLLVKQSDGWKIDSVAPNPPASD